MNPKQQIFNLSQNLLAIVGVKPLLCHSWTFQLTSIILCPGCEPGQTFQCLKCGYLMPWCRGADDEFLDWCDNCVANYEDL